MIEFGQWKSVQLNENITVGHCESFILLAWATTAGWMKTEDVWGVYAIAGRICCFVFTTIVHCNSHIKLVYTL